MTELLVAVGTGMVWVAPFPILVVCAGRLLRMRAGPAVLAAYPVFFALQVVLAKALAALGLLTTPAFRVSYGLLLVLGVGLCIRLLGWPPALHRPPTSARPDPDTALVRWMAIGTVGVVLAGLSVFALMVPVHVWDVLAYHMPMVASYIQNASLEAWPTQDLRQVYRVNAGEIQLLNVAILARSDAWIALPNLLALGVFMVGALVLARAAIPRRILAYLVVLLTLTAPQLLFGAVTGKNDLMFAAVLLAAFYWMVRAGRRARDRTAIALGLAALSAALAAATKVMGLNVAGAVGLLAIVLGMRGRLSYRQVLGFTGAGIIALLVLAGDVYLANLSRSAVPVGVAPGEVRFTIGPANVMHAVQYYAYELGFKRLVTPQPFEHDFTHYGYLYPILLVLGIAGAIRQLRTPRYGLAAITLASTALFVSVIAVRLPIRWDQRFMTWLIPVAAILALSLVPRIQARYLVAVGGAASAMSILTLALIVTGGADNLFHRSVDHLLATGSPATYVDVPNARYRYRDDGFDTLNREAAASDSVLYVGTDDSWMYPSWGRGFTRHVEGVGDAAHAATQVGTGRFRFIVLEEEVRPDIGDAVMGEAEASGYRPLVRAEGRVILVRGATAPDDEPLAEARP